MRDSIASGSEKIAFHYVKTDDGKIHAAWEGVDDTILVFEHIPENHPSTYHAVWQDKEDYAQSIASVEWITEAVDPDHEELVRLLREVPAECKN